MLFPAHRFRDSIQDQLHTFAFQCFLEFGGNFRIFARHDLRPVVNDGYAASVTPEHLPEFEADVAAAKNEQVLGNRGKLEDGFVGEKRHFAQSWNRRNVRAAAGVKENLFAFDDFFPDLNLMGCNKPRSSSIKAKILALIYAPLLAAAKAQHDLISLRHDFGQVHGDFRDLHSPARCVSCVMRNLRAVHHGLRRGASHVDARSSKMLFLNQGDRPSQVRKAKAEGVARLAGADNDGVIFHGVLRCEAHLRTFTSDAPRLNEDDEKPSLDRKSTRLNSSHVATSY